MLISRGRRILRARDRARIGLGRVILPLDSADAAARRRYRDFEAARHARTLAPHGDKRTLFAPDLVGSTEEIAAQLLADPILPLATEFRLELPYEFPREDYEQILTDFLTIRARVLAASQTRRISA